MSSISTTHRVGPVMTTRSRVWLVVYAPPIAIRPVRRVVGPFATVEEARRVIPPCPSEHCIGWRLLAGEVPPKARLLDEGGHLPATRVPDPVLRTAADIDDLAHLAAGGVLQAGIRRTALQRRGLIDGAGRISGLGRRQLALYRSRGSGSG